MDTRHGEIDIKHHEMSGLDVENSEVPKKIDGKACSLIVCHVEENRATSRNRLRLNELQHLLLIVSVGVDREHGVSIE